MPFPFPCFPFSSGQVEEGKEGKKGKETEGES